MLIYFVVIDWSCHGHVDQVLYFLDDDVMSFSGSQQSLGFKLMFLKTRNTYFVNYELIKIKDR